MYTFEFMIICSLFWRLCKHYNNRVHFEWVYHLYAQFGVNLRPGYKRTSLQAWHIQSFRGGGDSCWALWVFVFCVNSVVLGWPVETLVFLAPGSLLIVDIGMELEAKSIINSLLFILICVRCLRSSTHFSMIGYSLKTNKTKRARPIHKPVQERPLLKLSGWKLTRFNSRPFDSRGAVSGGGSL